MGRGLYGALRPHTPGHLQAPPSGTNRGGQDTRKRQLSYYVASVRTPISRNIHVAKCPSYKSKAAAGAAAPPAPYFLAGVGTSLIRVQDNSELPKSFCRTAKLAGWMVYLPGG